MTSFLLQTLLANLLPLVGTIVAALVSAVLLKLRQKYNIQVSDATRDSIHAALTRALIAVLTNRASAGLPIDLKSLNTEAIVDQAVSMVKLSNPQQVGKLKATTKVLQNVALSKLPDALTMLAYSAVPTPSLDAHKPH